MQCNENNIIDLNELNSKVDENRARKEAARLFRMARKAKTCRRVAIRCLILNFLCLAGVVAAILLKSFGVISPVFCVAATSIFAIISAYISGYFFGYAKASV